MSEAKRIRVAVVGAGMAGLTAALRLAERDYQVTVFERKAYVGGQFGAHTHVDGETLERYEHCYHMLLNWYHNFWQLARDIGIDFDRTFEPRPSFRYLIAGGARAPMLTNVGSPRHILSNMLSGVAPPPDVFLYAYSIIDLLAQPMRDDRRLDRYSVNGFLQSRPYATERAAVLHEHTLAKAFASPSYLSSAASYQNLMKFGLPDPEPMMWILKGNAWDYFHKPLLARLASLRCEVKLNHEIVGRFEVDGDRAHRLKCHDYGRAHWDDCFVGEHAIQAEPHRGRIDGDTRFYRDFDYLIIAVPPRAAAALVPDEYRARAAPTRRGRAYRYGRARGDKSTRRLEALQLDFPPYPKLKAEPMASLDLYFTRRLPNVPREHVILLDARYGLTFIDNSQAWGLPNTALNVVATDYHALSNLSDIRAARNAILAELKRYLPFNDDDIDYAKTHFQTNVGDELFINEVGSEQWRPDATTACPNVFLAGDYCRTPVDVTTIEAAVVSGLLAARALQEQAGRDGRLRPGEPGLRPIEIAERESYSQARMAALKLMLAPAAVAAKCWSWAFEQSALSSRPPGPRPPSPLPSDGGAPPGNLVATGINALMAPWAMGFDMLQAGWTMARDLARTSWPSRPDGR